jgi:hypothetical protein
VNNTEKYGGAGAAAGLAYFTIMFVTPRLDWLTEANQVEAVSMLFPIYAALFFNVRAAFVWCIAQLGSRNAPTPDDE